MNKSGSFAVSASSDRASARPKKNGNAATARFGAPQGGPQELVWVGRDGRNPVPISADREAFRFPRVSSDGKHIAVTVDGETRRSDIWIYDERGTKKRLTADHAAR